MHSSLPSNSGVTPAANLWQWRLAACWIWHRRDALIDFFFCCKSIPCLHIGNISSGNQPLRANYGNFNLNHTILIQGRTHERWEECFAKFMGDGRDDLQMCFCKSLLPPPLSAPLDQHHVAQIEVSIVFTERLVSTWYVALHISPPHSFLSCLFDFPSYSISISFWPKGFIFRIATK
jgi:hypothetical protein